MTQKQNINSTPAGNDCVRPDVINYDDIAQMVPKLRGHRKLVERVMHFLRLDEVNAVHGRWCDTPGPMFVKRMVEQDFKLKLRIDNAQVLDHLPKGAFITVSNHPFGALDGITLIYLITQHRPEFKVMVNMLLNKISAMRPNFIAVDQTKSDDPEKKKVSMRGVREAITMLKEGKPVGFFPAGTMSKINWKGQLEDGPWQKVVLQIIERSKVPVIPIYFQGSNSWLFNILGRVCWPLRSLRLPREVFRKRGKEIHVTIGDPITPEQQAAHDGSLEELGAYLRQKTYSLRK